MHTVPVSIRAQAELELRRRKQQHSYRFTPDIDTWIETEFFIPELLHLPDGSDNPCPAMQLAPYQRAVLLEACRRDEHGKFVYDFVLWSDIKKSIKSSIAAAVVLYRALNTPWGSFKIIANDLEQADSRVFFYIRRAIELNPKLKKRCTIRNYKITFDNNAFIQAIPVDPDGEAGGNDDMLEFTELHGFKSKAAQKLWTEATISPTKHGYSQRWADTYAGNSGESPILEPLYDNLVKAENLLDVGVPGLPLYANGRILCLWNTSPRLSWQTPEYYASEATILLPNEFRRVHGNEWTSSADVFVQPEWWSACYGDIPDFPPDYPVVIAMDAGVVNDYFALVGVSKYEGNVYVRFVRVWKPERGQKIDFDEVEQCIRNELVPSYNVVQIAYDNHQLHQMTTRLLRDGVAWMYEFSQGGDRLIADKQLRDLIIARLIVHDNHPQLTEGVLNANAQPDKEGRTLRIVKRAEHLKIDPCVALSMASHEILRLNV